MAVVLLANVFLGGWEMSEFGGGKCPPGKWLTIHFTLFHFEDFLPKKEAAKRSIVLVWIANLLFTVAGTSKTRSSSQMHWPGQTFCGPGSILKAGKTELERKWLLVCFCCNLNNWICIAWIRSAWGASSPSTIFRSFHDDLDRIFLLFFCADEKSNNPLDVIIPRPPSWANSLLE